MKFATTKTDTSTAPEVMDSPSVARNHSINWSVMPACSLGRTIAIGAPMPS